MFASQRFCNPLVIVAILVSLQGCAFWQSDDAQSFGAVDGYAQVYGENEGAIASVSPIATNAGMEAFAAGGNAIDAALAVAFTLGVVDSHNSGIGGGAFVLAGLANGEVIALDGREMAPQAASRDMYIIDGEVQPDLSRVGALATGVPGSVAAFYELQRRAGRLKFADVLLPAAELAETGVPMSGTVALRLQRTAETIAQFPASAAIFLDENSQPLTAGDLLVQQDLARSYRALAEHGPDWFYGGDFAQKAASWMAANGGIITQKDFTNYQLVEREPVQTEYNGYQIYGFPSPSSGGIHIGQMLNMLSHYDLSAMDETDRYHILAEVMQRAFADRAYWLGDADFVPVPEGLLDAGYAQERIQDIDERRASPGVQHGVPPASSSDLFDKHTTHFATADAQGNWVAITSTLNTSFGSKVVVPGTGVLLNNQMDDFAAQPGVPNAFGLVGAEANSIAPGKRPLSSMAPTIVGRDGDLMMTLGAAGGPTIITQVLQTLLYHLELGWPIEEAVAGPRVHHQWLPSELFVEDSIEESVREALMERGHSLRALGSFGGTQAIVRDGDRFVPVTEPRLILRNLKHAP